MNAARMPSLWQWLLLWLCLRLLIHRRQRMPETRLVLKRRK